MTESSSEPISLLRHKQFGLYWWTRLLSTAGYQILQVAIQWEIYQLTSSALHLGLVGLIMFIPVIAGTFIIGHVADHYDRRRVIAICQLSKAAGALILIGAIYFGALSVTLIYLVVFIVGAARAFEGPTLHTILPSVMPQEVLSRAIAAGATAHQMATIGGPAVGGFLLALGTNLVYFVCFAMLIIASICITLVQVQRPAKSKKAVTLESVLAGFTYIKTRPVIFGAISLDLAAVLVGSVTALLPIFARDILDAGPQGLGLLRASPAAGALLMWFYLSNIQIDRHAGRIMIGAVAVYGLATTAFGLSSWLPISMLMLGITGAAIRSASSCGIRWCRPARRMRCSAASWR